MVSLSQLRGDVEQELTGNILSFYLEHALDEQQGGFYGRIDNDNRIHHQAAKGLIQNSRYLWTFSRAFRQLRVHEYRILADRAYAYLRDHFWDQDAGGLFWLVDYQGRPLRSDKYIYGQSYGVYGLSEYYLATGDESSLHLATTLFQLLEEKARDSQHGGYFEHYQQDWGKRLSKNVDKVPGPVDKTMNSHLHLLEAYANLYQAWPDQQLSYALRGLIRLHLDRIIDPATSHLRQQFTANWTPLNNHISCGHDIEASWLLVEAAEVLGDAGLLAETEGTALRMAQIVYDQGIDTDGGLLDGSGHTAKVWWPQAEALVGFLNAYQQSQEPHYLAAVIAIWDYLQAALIDQVNGEWFYGRQGDGALLEEYKVGRWKTPYHNGRACMELMSRLDKFDLTLQISVEV